MENVFKGIQAKQLKKFITIIITLEFGNNEKNIFATETTILAKFCLSAVYN